MSALATAIQVALSIMKSTERYEQAEIDASIARERVGSGRWDRAYQILLQGRPLAEEQIGRLIDEDVVTIEGATRVLGAFMKEPLDEIE